MLRSRSQHMRSSCQKCGPEFIGLIKRAVGSLVSYITGRLGLQRMRIVDALEDVRRGRQASRDCIPHNALRRCERVCAHRLNVQEDETARLRQRAFPMSLIKGGKVHQRCCKE
eukprot:6175454-Pleurochrysis_carterae.AAC.2